MPHSEHSYELASPDRPPQLNFACRCRCGCGCGCNLGSETDGGGDHDQGGATLSREELFARPNVEGLVSDSSNASEEQSAFQNDGSGSEMVQQKCGLISLDVDCLEGSAQDDPGTPNSMVNEGKVSGYQSSSSSIMSLRPYSPSMLLGLIPQSEPLPGLFCKPPLRLTPDGPRIILKYPMELWWMQDNVTTYPQTIANEDLES